MPFKFNPFTGALDISPKRLAIPELTSDPVSPYHGQPWVLKDTTFNGDQFLAFFGAMPLTNDDMFNTFYFSVYTSEGTKRTEIL